MHGIRRESLIPWAFLLVAMMFSIGAQSLRAQTETAPIEGIRENTPRVHAFVNARIVQAPGKVIEKGTIVLRDGIIEAVGAKITPPEDARIWNYEGLTIYPGLIESYSQLGMPKEKKGDQQSDSDHPDYWNENVRPEKEAIDLYQPKTEDLKKLRELGFTAALIEPDDHIFSGSAALVSLADGVPNEQIIKANIAQNIMFKRSGSFADRSYPNSLMGVIALIRQTLLDAQWYRQAQDAYAMNPTGQSRPEMDESLAALNGVVQKQQPVMFNVDDDQDFLRVLEIVKEFGLQAWIVGSGHEYRQLTKIKAAGVPVILPLDFPDAPAVESPEEALGVSLMELSHWEAAPENPKRLQDAGVTVALSTTKLKKTSDFPKQLRAAIERGLSADAALAALTTNPARMFGVQNRLGTIEAGKLGDLVVTDGELFGKETKVLDVWIDGNRYEVQKQPEVEPAGKYTVVLHFPAEAANLDLELKGKAPKFSGSLLKDSTKIELKNIELDHKRLTMSFQGKELGHDGVVRLSGGLKDKVLSGQGQLPDGSWFRWSANWQAPIASEQEDSEEEPEAAQQPAHELTEPPGAYGRLTPPAQPKQVLVQNATIWTCGPDGTLKDADLLITEGKITKVGAGLSAPSDATIVDAQGKHVTPGLIDAHSHTGISGGVNESAQAVTAEVRIADVINDYDIAFYRELAGGLTAINQLHGSANPIGGQNSVIKLRWGVPANDMKIADAIPGIKFALGENVKQSNWGDRFTSRYPQTRMGVEQIIRDRFKAALDYEREWQQYHSLKNKKGVIPPRRDLELETLLEVLHGKRLVHSHSYRQDEILMLLRVAEDFGFTMGTFQHVLEGYKVADAMANLGAGASTFSDWWAYKFEVYDAIPYNGTLMHDAGVVVSFNSDSNELARRMNLEAAKAVKYGGLSEEEALKFVTLNPAKQLRIDNRVGSLEPGKDADFVLWSGHPLSTYSICLQTWIDGRKYFDREEDSKMQLQVQRERARLIQKVLASKSKDRKKPDASKEKPTD